MNTANNISSGDSRLAATPTIGSALSKIVAYSGDKLDQALAIYSLRLVAKSFQLPPLRAHRIKTLVRALATSAVDLAAWLLADPAAIDDRYGDLHRAAAMGGAATVALLQPTVYGDLSHANAQFAAACAAGRVDVLQYLVEKCKQTPGGSWIGTMAYGLAVSRSIRCYSYLRYAVPGYDTDLRYQLAWHELGRENTLTEVILTVLMIPPWDGMWFVAMEQPWLYELYTRCGYEKPANVIAGDYMQHAFVCINPKQGPKRFM